MATGHLVEVPQTPRVNQSVCQSRLRFHKAAHTVAGRRDVGQCGRAPAPLDVNACMLCCGHTLIIAAAASGTRASVNSCEKIVEESRRTAIDERRIAVTPAASPSLRTPLMRRADPTHRSYAYRCGGHVGLVWCGYTQRLVWCAPKGKLYDHALQPMSKMLHAPSCNDPLSPSQEEHEPYPQAMTACIFRWAAQNRLCRIGALVCSEQPRIARCSGSGRYTLGPAGWSGVPPLRLPLTGPAVRVPDTSQPHSQELRALRQPGLSLKGSRHSRL